MNETYQHGLPLLAGGQAQKHVTVNEALSVLDAVAQLRIVSRDLTVPPQAAVDGQTYVVPSGATGAWAGQEGRIALWANGGWKYFQPRIGWVAWCEASGASMTFDGVDWQEDAVVTSGSGAGTLFRIAEVDHTVSPGPISVATGLLPAGAVVFGVTGRVIEAITGAASAWTLGAGTSPDRYGTGYGIARNSWASGLTSQPLAYYSDTDLVLTAEGGDFSGGMVRLAVHYMQMIVPRQT
ncbi:DUF2793 domain-containing protein [Rhodobacteraceae bacterium 2CG4]|uniref:DUF2793 domain-containing protein n=1 Tax=Halovulum marinum TaxID=2662447 RepID=A0A6L5YXF0_9RHOB|nr:DUF2793 domain-containing protein [Halovulum marinum]MSU89013.1 DUF2793 domain-containing protein [Halovulum marinum]